MDNLIFKYLSNTASEEEVTILFQWVEASSENKKLFIQLKKAWVLTASSKSETDWIKIKNKLQFPEPITQLKGQKHSNKSGKNNMLSIVKPWFRYAVAASIVLLISVFLFINKEGDSSTELQEVSVTNSIIQIGTDKATLTLEDGSNIVLEEGQSYSNANVKSNGEKIIYEKIDNINDVSKIVYNYLTIPRGGQFFVVLEDGTKVWLNSESQLKYPKFFVKGETRRVELVYGEAYFDVSPSTDHEGSLFKVLTGEQEIEVLGTEFNVKAYQDEAYVYTTLVEGKVVLDNKIQKKTLEPSQQSALNKETKAVEISKVNVATEISWRDGFFSFKNKSLKEIAKVLSRWYDVEILFVEKSMENVLFKGVLSKNQDLEEILTIIKNTKFINAYEIKNNAIIIK
ncbi:FecR domain-containing protein [Snuella sp. CAU 1569]|uniref:FecR domain-containing protein n=2 Tax=Snuella sedimenti TaxID=2798802 RepID=A0A8J7J594_9FLAO|nr:FecR domain-containing protein [Snuella sedimenti]